MTTASQDQWQEMMDAIRGELAKQIPLMGAMKPAEQKDFVEAVNSARWGEESAACFDVEIEARKEKAIRKYE